MLAALIGGDVGRAEKIVHEFRLELIGSGDQRDYWAEQAMLLEKEIAGAISRALADLEQRLPKLLIARKFAELTDKIELLRSKLKSVEQQVALRKIVRQVALAKAEKGPDPLALQRLGQVGAAVSKVRTVLFCALDQLLVAGGRDGTVHLYNATDGLPFHQMAGHKGFVHALAVSGNLLASGGEDGHVCLWSLSDGRLIRRLDGKGSALTALAFLPPKKPKGTKKSGVARNMLVAGAANGRLYLWDVDRGDLMATRNAHVGAVTSLTYSRAYERFASAGMDGAVRTWSRGEATPIQARTFHAGAVRSISYHPSGTMIASGGDDGAVQVWELWRGGDVRVVGVHEGPATSVDFRPADKELHVASGGDDGRLAVWEARSGAELFSATAHKGGVVALAYDRGSHRIVSAGSDGALFVWGPKEFAREKSKHLRVFPQPATAVAFGPKNKTLYIAGLDGVFRWVFPDKGLEKLPIPSNSSWPVLRILPDPRGRYLLLLRNINGVQLYNLETRNLKTVHEPKALNKVQVRGLAFSQDGQRVAYSLSGTRSTLSNAGRFGTEQVSALVIVDVRSNAVRRLELGNYEAGPLAFAGGGKQVVIVGIRSIRIYSVEDGKQLGGLKLPEELMATISVGYHDPTKRLALGTIGGTIYIYDLGARKLVSRLVGHRDTVYALHFCSDGARIVSRGGQRDGRAVLWDPATGKQLALYKHVGLVGDAAISPDGRWWATASNDCTVRMWKAP